MVDASLKEAGERCVQAFKQLGDRIERQWQRHDYDEVTLPSIAASALSEEALHRKVQGRDIAAWVITCEQMGAQPNAKTPFGQPPITLYRGRRFYIEALQWLDSTTAIHQHGFSGAFSVLEGGSVHTFYQFHEAKRRTDQLLFGDLVVQDSEVLKPGDVRPIASGRDFIHALFHLEHPSVSIVVRSVASPNAELQYAYQPPYIAFNPFDDDLWATKVVGYVHGLLAKSSPEAPRFVASAIAAADARWAYDLLVQFGSPQLGERLKVSADFAEAVAHAAHRAAQEKFGDDYPVVMLSHQEDRRIDGINRLRGRVKDPNERFFLALLMNVPNPARLLELVHDKFPHEDPAARVEDWVRALMNEGTHRADVAIGDDALLLIPSVIRNEPFKKALWRMEAVHGKLDPSDHGAIAQALDNIRGLDLMRVFSGRSLPAPYAKARGA